MGKEEYVEILEGIVNDADTAGRVAEGDFSDLSAGELTDAEQALLTAAAGDLDSDVSGFGDWDPKLGMKWKVEEGEAFNATPNVKRAMGYLKLDYIKFDG